MIYLNILVLWINKATALHYPPFPCNNQSLTPPLLESSFSFLSLYIYTHNRINILVLFGPLCLLSIASEPKREMLFIRLPHLQNVEVNHHFFLEELKNFPLPKVCFQCSIFPYFTDIKPDMLSASFIHSIYVKPCTTYSYSRGSTDGLQRPMNF